MHSRKFNNVSEALQESYLNSIAANAWELSTLHMQISGIMQMHHD